MLRAVFVTWSMAALLGVAASAGQAPTTAIDAAFTAFLQAATPRDAAATIDSVVATGVGFDAALTRLKAGRAYSSDVPRGVAQASYRSDSGEYFYTLDVPERYDPARRYQVRMQLHGGVGRIDQNVAPRAGSNARLAGAEQIYVMPYAWKDAPWWSRRQAANLASILDLVKRTYNVDENRIVLSGVSDGGTGVYYTAMRETTPFASFLPFIGFIGVLRNETADADGDLFPNNLVNKPMFIVNGGRDPQYPTSMVDPYIDHLKTHGVDLVYRPQPNAAHDTSWWPELKESVEQFVSAHPRRPLPDVLTWESGEVPSRAHWLVIDRLAGTDARDLPDVNLRATPPAADFGIRSSGARINRVVNGSNAQQLGLKSGDTIASINNQPVTAAADVAEMLRGFPAGRPLILGVVRNGQPMRVTGRYNPSVLVGEAQWMFPPAQASGRIDLVRAGNTVTATTRGVGTFTLLLSPDQFDFNTPITVVVNGVTKFEGRVQTSVATLLKWAARDNDRTMLFGAEVHLTI